MPEELNPFQLIEHTAFVEQLHTASADDVRTEREMRWSWSPGAAC
jgi:hypothetical protein